jgi:four helix bundle protein
MRRGDGSGEIFERARKVTHWQFASCDLKMTERELIERTKRFALRVIKLAGALPRTIERRSIAGQLMRSGTSVAANYRAACRARSKPEFIAKLGTVEEEADESAFWLELIIEAGLLSEGKIRPLLDEANEIVAMMASSKKTASHGAKLQIANRKSQIT